jgi:sterol desaturase/sphingolipid hydroxylase (fatty acid hydroxylase superfamily)
MDLLNFFAEWLSLKAVLIACLIFIPLERLLAMHPLQRILRRGWWNDVIYQFVNGWLIKLGMLIILAGTVVVSAWLIPTPVRAAVAGQPYWLQIVEVILVADLGFYFAHRMFHAIPLLWRFHQIHHSIEELDWLAGARVHPVDQIATKGISLLPVFALGFSEAAIAVFALVYQWQSILLHSNISISFGPLRWLIASPNFHHWHHSKEVAARDKNFAGQLSLLDVLFGTAHMPRGQVPSQYGIDEPLPPTYLSQLLHPFRRVGQRPAALKEVKIPGASSVSMHATMRPKTGRLRIAIALLRREGGPTSSTVETGTAQ